MSSAQQIANSFVVDFFERLASNPATLGELYSQHAEVTISDFELGTTEARGAEVPSTVEQWAMIVQGSRLRVESVNAAPLYSGVNVFVTLSAIGEMQQYFQITTTLEAYTGGFAVECYCIRHQVLSRIGALPAEQPATSAAATHDAEATTAAAPATNDGATSTTPAAAPEHAAAAEPAHKADEAAAATAAAAGEATAKQNEAAAANGSSAAAAAHSNDAATAAEVQQQQQQHSGSHGAAAKKASSGKAADATAAAAAPAASTTTAASSSSSKVKSWAKLASTAPAKHVDASKVIRVVAATAHAATPATAATATTTAVAATAPAAASAAPATATTATPAARDERGRAHEGASAASRPPAAGAAKPLSQQPGQAQAPFVRRERRPVEPVGDRLIFNIDTTVTDDEVKAALGPLASSIVSLRNQSDRGRVFMDFAVNVKAYDQLRKMQPTLGSNKTRMMVYHQRPREGN